MADKLGTEFEKLGMVAMIAALLVPGMFWITKAKSTAAMIARAALVGGLIVGSVRIEALMDDSVAELTE